MKNPGGRPTKYTEELADALCALLAQGYSLNKLLNTEHGKKAIQEIGYDGDLPSMVTVFSWFKTNETFLKNYARAKQESADAMADEILDISDEGINDWMEIYDKEGKNVIGWRVNGEAVQRSKLRVDTRKFLMAKMKPKKYGDKLDLTSDGKRIETTPVVVSNIVSRKDEAKKDEK